MYEVCKRVHQPFAGLNERSRVEIPAAFGFFAWFIYNMALLHK
jgi:hypothetical protein